MKNILTIFKKEWDRVIKDKRLVITVIILPGLMLFIIYSFIGNAITNVNNDDIMNVAIYNPQQEFKNIYELAEDNDRLNVISITQDRIPYYEQKVDDKDWTLVIIFDDDINTYAQTGDKPIVDIYSNPNDLGSSSVASRFTGYINVYLRQLTGLDETNFFIINRIGTEVNQSVLTGTMMSSLLPMLVVVFLFSGAMSVGPESIAGEKERGTIATLLVTPVKRSQIAFGKVLSLSVLSLLSAVSSFIGIALSLPKLLNLSDTNIGSIYNIGDYLMILVLLFTTVFVIVGIISIISAYAKTLKEATSLIMPVYILSILVSISTMFGDGANENVFMYLIPIYSTVQTMISILMFDDKSWVYLLVTVISNIAYVSFLVYILNRMFKNEKIMFAK